MKKVITYGTYDLLHYGHIRLLERAKELGDYLIVGVTSDDFDKHRGKINVQQSLMERIQAVKNTGLADEIIVEEYDGQKIDDIIKYGVDIFTVGSDWEGTFDYLKDYCEVVYLSRTEGISSSSIRTKNSQLKIGLIGSIDHTKKIYNECKFVNGIEIAGICVEEDNDYETYLGKNDFVTSNYNELLDRVDAVFIINHPTKHYNYIKKALNKKKHVICESPITLKKEQLEELYEVAEKKKCILMEGLKTAYSTAYSRLLLLLKCGIIGNIISVEATCTSLKNLNEYKLSDIKNNWNSICSWGPTALLPIFQILGTNYKTKNIISKYINKKEHFDTFTKIDFVYDNATAAMKVGKGIKSEGELIVSGTKGYVYVPAPWWKTDYFEIRYEDTTKNQRYFYQLDGEGIRYELVNFVKATKDKQQSHIILKDVSKAIIKVIEDFYNDEVTEIK